MYINFWYPMIRSEDLGPDQPEKVKCLGLNFVAFRDDEGEAHVLSDTCVHRGGSLGGAWSGPESAPRIVNGCVVCPYHGWEFGGDGVCQNIPSIGYGTKPPARAKIDSYPVEEKYGIVFAFLGDLPEEERPPLLESGGIRPGRVARQFRAGPGGGLLLRTIYRERTRPGDTMSSCTRPTASPG